MPDPYQLACLLWQYEADEPHLDNDDEGDYPEMTVVCLRQLLQDSHLDNCSGWCPRCVAEEAVHKARWLCERLEPTDA